MCRSPTWTGWRPTSRRNCRARPARRCSTMPGRPSSSRPCLHGCLDYATLGRQVAVLAAHLQGQGAPLPGQRIALCLPRSRALVLHMLAAWQCGATFLVVDPAWPASRQQAICEDDLLERRSNHRPAPTVGARDAGLRCLHLRFQWPSQGRDRQPRQPHPLRQRLPGPTGPAGTHGAVRCAAQRSTPALVGRITRVRCRGPGRYPARPARGPAEDRAIAPQRLAGGVPAAARVAAPVPDVRWRCARRRADRSGA